MRRSKRGGGGHVTGPGGVHVFGLHQDIHVSRLREFQPGIQLDGMRIFSLYHILTCHGSESALTIHEIFHSIYSGKF